MDGLEFTIDPNDTRLARQQQQQLQGFFGKPPGNAAAQPAYGHSSAVLQAAGPQVLEYYYIVTSPPHGLLPAFQVSTFRVAVGVKGAGNMTFPSEFYTTRGEAQKAAADRVREQLVDLAKELVEQMTQSALGQGLNEDPELDLTDALRQYLKAVQT